MNILKRWFGNKQTVPPSKVGAKPAMVAPKVSLHQAVRADDVNAINQAIANGAPADERDEMGLTALATAAALGKAAAVAALIDHGANVDATDHDKTTPLLLAVARGHTAIAELLLQKGADPNTQTTEGCTPLFFAQTKSIAELLIARDARVRSRATDGSTPLICAAKNNLTEVVETLIAHGADINAKDANGLTALTSAIISHNANKPYDSIPALIAKNVNVNLKDNNGITALHVAAHKGERGIVGLLLSAGADKLIKANDGTTPAILARQSGNIDIEKLISSNRITKRTFNTRGVPDLAPEDVISGIPEGSTSPRDGGVPFGIQTPEGAYIGFSHPTKEIALMIVEETRTYLRNHRVYGDLQSVNMMMIEIDKAVTNRINNRMQSSELDKMTKPQNVCSKHPAKPTLRIKCRECNRTPLCEECLRLVSEGPINWYYCADCKPGAARASPRLLERLRADAS